jgi:NAD dependent epimerase/dehydratase family enzyme
MTLPSKFGFGSALGSGNQFLPWVHIKDVVNIISKSIGDTKMHGPYNVVAPSYDNYNEFSKTLAQVLNKPYFMPNVPSFLLKLALGEMSAIVLEGSRISSEKLIKNGYKFQFSNLEFALKNLLITNS